MSGTSFVVDLSRLPAPTVVQTLDYEVILAEMLADLRARDPAYNTISEADPAYKILEVCAFREMILRQRINDSAQAVLLAQASGADLDHIVAREPYNIERLQIDPGNPAAIPPLPPIYESDDVLRRRAQLAPARYSVAGPRDAYVFHALSADARVLDASATSPELGVVMVSVLSREADGVAPQDLLDTVQAALSHRTVRPLTDEVLVQSAEIIDYAVLIDLTLFRGPDQAVVLAAAQSRVEEYTARSWRLGRDISESALIAAAHVEGVHRAVVISPAGDIPVDLHQAARCTQVGLSVVGHYDD